MTEQIDSHAFLKLRPRLVPEPLWDLSAYRLLKQSEWQRIRRDALADAAGACAVCGAIRGKGMVCDEDWTYGDGVAQLVGVRIICPDCNAVTHFGRTRVAGYGDIALAHMARVNGSTLGEAERLVALEDEVGRKRSESRWEVAVAPDLLARYPALSVLVGRTSTPGVGRARMQVRKSRVSDFLAEASEFGDGSTGTIEDIEHGRYLRDLAERDD